MTRPPTPDALLALQRRYYERARSLCAERAALHPAALAALDAHLALCDRAGTERRFTAALTSGGHATALARAEQHDRFAGEAAIARALGDAATAAAADRAALALAAPGDAAFAAAAAATAAVGQTLGVATAVAEQASRLVEAAIDLACDPDPVRAAEYRARAIAAWHTARALDPGFGLAALAAPPIRHRLPFGPGALPALRELIERAVGAPAVVDGPPVAAPPDAPPTHTPTFDEVAALALDGWPAPPPADPAALEAAVAALDAGLPHPARAAALETLAADAGAADDAHEPALAALARRAADGVAAARTSTALWTWMNWHGAVAPIEQRWWGLLVHAALWPALALLIDPARPARALPAARTAARLFGCGPVEALSAPYVTAALRRQLLDAGQSLDEERPVRGPGGGHVALARATAAVHAARAIHAAASAGLPVPRAADAAVRYRDASALIADVAAALAATDVPRGGVGAVVLWDTRVALDALDGVQAEVVRPAPTGLW